MNNQLYVITGGPGSGKTTLIEALAAAGYATAPEAGRAIIIDQAAIGRPDIGTHDPALFAELMLSWDMRSYRWALQQPGPVFFDHAVAGMPAYFRLTGLPVPSHVAAAAEAFRYARQAFIAPPWREIYRTDEERHQTFDEAVRTFEAAAVGYREQGYELLELPKCDVSGRLAFVLGHLSLPVPAPC